MPGRPPQRVLVVIPAWNEAGAIAGTIAEGQHDPTYLPQLLAGLEHSDVVIGARFAGEGDYAARGPRRWAMRMLAAVLSKLSGARLTDVTSGFRVANRKAVRVFADHYPA